MSDVPISTKEHPSPYDGLEKAQPDEPLFTLLARDPDAAPLVLEWAERRRSRARWIDDPADRRAELQQCNEAEEVAWAMQRWRKGEEEVVVETRASYNDTAIDEPWRREISLALQHLRNAAYSLNEGREMFDRLGLLDDDDRQMLQSAKTIANNLADERTPKRASFAAQPTLDFIKGGQK